MALQIMIGILFFLFEFYDDQLLAFTVLILVWLSELFTLIRSFPSLSHYKYIATDLGCRIYLYMLSLLEMKCNICHLLLGQASLCDGSIAVKQIVLFGLLRFSFKKLKLKAVQFSVYGLQ